MAFPVAKDKARAPVTEVTDAEPVIEAAPVLLPQRTLDEMEAGRKMAAVNAAALEKATKEREADAAAADAAAADKKAADAAVAEAIAAKGG